MICGKTKMKKYTINLEPLGKKISVNEGTPLIDILSEFGVEFPCGSKGSCGGCKVKLLAGNIPLEEQHKKLLQKHKLNDNWRLACQCAVNDNITLEVGQWKSFVLADNTPFDFSPHEGLGIAIDLGSTTIVAQLLDRQTANVIDVRTIQNPQVRYGADIISRIEFALTTDGLITLQNLIRHTIRELLNDWFKNFSDQIRKVVIAGNTAMHHFFSGIDVSPLSYYPFETEHKEMSFFTPQELDWQLPDDTSIVFLPLIGSFVGSDILAGIVASKIHLSNDYAVLIDFGTNGEIVVGNKHRLLCASTAAGPAFEGTSISVGMRAMPGAITSLNNVGGKFNYHSLGNETPRGICGSALIDAIAILRNNETIDESGAITTGDEKIEIIPTISLTQRDIREFQLAKAAIAAGIAVIMKQLDINQRDIKNVFVAGAFGYYINLQNAFSTGLLEFEEAIISKIGNSSLIGAKMFLFLPDSYTETVLSITEHISLESAPEFQDIFIEKMMFA